MARAGDHIALGRRFQRTLDSLCSDVASNAEWIAVIACYKAVHLIEALFDADSRIHSGSHGERNQLLRSVHRYQQISRQFKPLYEASLVARYLTCNQGAYRMFTDYIPEKQVVPTILSHHLHRVEESVARLLPRELSKQLLAKKDASAN